MLGNAVQQVSECSVAIGKQRSDLEFRQRSELVSSAVLYNAAQCWVIQCSAMLGNTVQRSELKCVAENRDAAQCLVMQCSKFRNEV